MQQRTIMTRRAPVAAAVRTSGYPLQRSRHRHQHGERRHEHRPPGERVKESGRRRRADVVGGEAGAGDAQAVGDDGDRNARQRDGDARSQSRIGEVAVQHRQGEQRQQRTDAAARFGHFERRVRERDDVAFPQHRNAEAAAARRRRTWSPAPEAGNVELVEKHRRNRE